MVRFSPHGFHGPPVFAPPAHAPLIPRTPARRAVTAAPRSKPRPRMRSSSCCRTRSRPAPRPPPELQPRSSDGHVPGRPLCACRAGAQRGGVRAFARGRRRRPPRPRPARPPGAVPPPNAVPTSCLRVYLLLRRRRRRSPRFRKCLPIPIIDSALPCVCRLFFPACRPGAPPSCGAHKPCVACSCLESPVGCLARPLVRRVTNDTK